MLLSGVFLFFPAMQEPVFVRTFLMV